MSKSNCCVDGNCNNCGKQGHQFHQCKLPITSYGVIVFRHSPRHGLQYLLIRRKNSFGYIDFIRGKYASYNCDHLQNIFDEMSMEEKRQIQGHSFYELWKSMWSLGSLGSLETTEITGFPFKGEELSSQRRFDLLKSNGMIDTFIRQSTTTWEETEWEFPKGRRNYQEKELECALREFEEETGISKSQVSVVENMLPLEEIFIGSNYKLYKHKYFLAQYKTKGEDNNNCSHFQSTEVSKLEWKSLEEALASIRPYHLEKKNLLVQVHRILTEYYLHTNFL